MWHGDSPRARLILLGLACALSSPGTTWTSPVLPSEAFMAPQVLEQMALRAALSLSPSAVGLRERTLISMMVHFLIHQMEPASYGFLRGI